MNVRIEITGLDLMARRLGTVIGPAAARGINEAAALRVKEVTRIHLDGLAGSEHTTANRLGATPTGHLEQAALAVERAPVTASDDGAFFTINHPGMGRALHDVTIVPGGGKKFLAIPLNAIAYGRRAAELFQTGEKVVFNPGRGNVPQDIAAYLLVRSVTQKQDRSLLPSDSEWQDAAREGAEDFFDRTIPAA